jgi:hypothetical protein
MPFPRKNLEFNRDAIGLQTRCNPPGFRHGKHLVPVSMDE